MRMIVAVLATCGLAWTQETPKPAETQKKTDVPQEKKVVVTASPLNARSEFDTPYHATIVGNEIFLGERQTKNTPDAFRELPGTSIQKSGPAQGSPFIRGWTGFRNVLLIDGIRLNNSVFREGPNQYWATIDPYLIDRLELVRGPSSVLYGSDSIGGTVQAFSKEPSTREAGSHVHARSIGRYASGENSYAARQEVSGNFDELGWFVGGTYRDFHDMSGGRRYGEMVGTGFDEYDADLKFVYRTGENSKLVLAAQRHRTEDASRWHSTADSRSWHGTSPGTDIRRDFDQERDLYYLQYHWAGEGAVDSFKAGVSWHEQNERENRIRASQQRDVRDAWVDTAGVWAQAGKKTGLGYVTFGGEFYHDDVQSDGYNVTLAGVVTDFQRGNVADDATYDLMGIYLQDEFSIGALDITPGIRYSRAEVDADQVDPVAGGTTFPSFDESYDAVTGSLRLLYHVEEHWNVVAGWGLGFRAPNLSDTSGSSTALSGVTEVPSPDLDPEYFHSFDLGVRARYDDFGFSLFGFYTIIEDLIIRVPTAVPATTAKDNGGEGYMYGFELEAYLKIFEDVTLFADWGYAKGEAEQVIDTAGSKQDEPLGKIGPSLGHVGVRYQPAPRKGWIEGVVTVAARQDHLAPFEGTNDTQRIPPKHGTPGYTIYTLRGGYSISEQVSTTVAVENISDKDYRVHGSGQNEPGTNFIASLDVRF